MIGRRLSDLKQIFFIRFSAAFTTCEQLKSKESWKILAQEALKNLEIELALRAYKQCDDIAMVNAIEEILYVEDQNLIAGYASMFLGNYQCAQKWFLESSNPTVALEMRADLLQWDEALNLSKKMAPEQVPYLSREYAQQLEFT